MIGMRGRDESQIGEVQGTGKRRRINTRTGKGREETTIEDSHSLQCGVGREEIGDGVSDQRIAHVDLVPFLSMSRACVRWEWSSE